MEWAAVVNNPILKDLPFKIELNKWGKILMTPASNNHGNLQYETAALIDRRKGSGKIILECSINTTDGVKVADVAWASDAFIAENGYDTPYQRAPEICVEIVSPSNSRGELAEKIELYLAKGAIEVWIVDEAAGPTYHTHEGEIDRSREVDQQD